MKRRLRTVVVALCVLAGLGLALRHDVIDLLQARGRAQLQQGDVASARAAFARAVGLGGDSAPLTYDLGVALYRHGDFAGAQQKFAIAMGATAPDLAVAARFNRGNSVFRQGESLAAGDRQAAARMFEAAVADYRAVLAHSPGAADARDNLSLAEARLAALESQAAANEIPSAAATAAPQFATGAKGNGDARGEGRSSPRPPSDPRPAAPRTAGAGDRPKPTASASGKSHPDLTPDEVERILNDARGREKLTGLPHHARSQDALAKPDKDW
jgi:tetratricopeptide (TPR) repeat protein